LNLQQLFVTTNNFQITDQIMQNQQSSDNPTNKHPKPPFPKQYQPAPGKEDNLKLDADHG